MWIRTAVLLVAVLLAGCATPSVHPIWSSDKNIEDPALIGAWRGDDDSPVYHMSTRDQGLRLRAVSAKNGKSDEWEFDVRLLKLGSHKYADLTASAKEREAKDEKWGTFFIATHMFLRYQVEGDELTVWLPNREWLQKALNEDRIKLTATPLNDHTLLLTSETPGLQAFLLEHAETEGAFDKVELRRQIPEK